MSWVPLVGTTPADPVPAPGVVWGLVL